MPGGAAALRILLVEDELLVRETLTDELRDNGFDVVAAGSGEEALGIYAPGAFDALVTDIRMPGALDGWDLAERCRASSPGLPVIYMTGYSDVPARQVDGSRLLRKPFHLEEFAKALSSMTRDLRR